jgi:hypothetical protein
MKYSGDYEQWFGMKAWDILRLCPLNPMELLKTILKFLSHGS